MKAKKLFYYLNSLLKVNVFLKNKSALFNFIFDKKVTFIFKNGLKLQIISWLDLLILKETIIDDFYQLKKCKNPRLIVDIGAGLGDFSLLAAKKYSQAKIIAFEPHPQLFQLLRKNIIVNDTKNIIPYKKAVTSQKNIILNIGQEGTQSSFFKNINRKKTIKVIGYDLNQLLKNNYLDFLKIDCEGGEWKIIKNLSGNNLKKIKIISLEYHRQYVKDVDLLLQKKLSLNGFRCTVHPDKFDKNIGHLIAVKKN